MKDATQTSTVRPDQNTAQWQDLWRKSIAGALGGLTGNSALTSYAGDFGKGFGLPDYSGVRANLMSDFDRQRAQAGMTANDLATKAHAFGGSRSAVLQSNLLNDVNRNETNALTGLDVQANQEQFQRLMQLLGLAGGAAGVGGQVNQQQMYRNPIGGAIGGAAAGSQFGPIGAGVGGIIGLLGS